MLNRVKVLMVSQLGFYEEFLGVEVSILLPASVFYMKQ